MRKINFKQYAKVGAWNENSKGVTIGLTPVVDLHRLRGYPNIEYRVGSRVRKLENMNQVALTP